MKIEDLIQLLNSRLREFKLSRDYARMSGNLERMNEADKEVLTLEDTIYQLNLLVDTSKSVAIKETTLAEVITDGSVSVLGEYDITPYATDPLHEEKVMKILSKMGVMDTVEKIDNYIKGKYLSSPVTGEMVMNASLAYNVDARLIMAMMEQDSSFGTAGLAVSTLNPGNVGNDDSGNTRTYGSWQEGVTAVAGWLNRHRISQGIINETIPLSTATSTTPISIPETSTSTPITATSTNEITPLVTSTTTTTFSIPEIATSTSETSTSTTPITIPETSTSTPETSTSTTPISIPETSTSTPVTATSTNEITPTVTSTTTTTIGTPETSTSTPETILSTFPISTPTTATSTTN